MAQWRCPLRVLAEEFGLLVDDSDGGSASDVDMESSPLAARAASGPRGMECGPGGPGVDPVVLFPAVPDLPEVVERPVREGTVPDSVDSGDSVFDEGLTDLGRYEPHDPASGGGGRDGRCECSCEAKLGHLNGKVRKLHVLVCLLLANAGLAGWEETRRVDNLRTKIGLEREVAERDHARKVATGGAESEEKKKFVKREEQVRRAEEVRKSQMEAARLRREQLAAAQASL